MGRFDTTTMGDLVAHQLHMHPVEKFYFRRLVAFLEVHYPKGWQSWTIKTAHGTELWGETMPQEIEHQILLAVPTAELALIFGCAPAAMTPLYVQVIRRWLMTWELGRALIVAPTWIYRRIHTADRYVGLALNPLTFGRTPESELDTASVIHEACQAGPVHGYMGAPLPWGAVVQGCAVTHDPDLRAPGTPLPWTSLSLEAVVAGAQVPLHECNLFPDFDS